MPLSDVNVPIKERTLPGDVRSFLREADRRIERFRFEHNIPAFVPSDYARAYNILSALNEANVAAGNLFCEWGSGFGVVACLAAMLDFDACGIEIEDDLVAEARRLASDFDLPVEFIRGSFIPKGSERSMEHVEGFAWLATDEDDLLGELELSSTDFDVVFAYPWPDEEVAIASIFEQHARAGALLVSYHEGDDMRLRRKKNRMRGSHGKK